VLAGVDAELHFYHEDEDRLVAPQENHDVGAALGRQQLADLTGDDRYARERRKLQDPGATECFEREQRLAAEKLDELFVKKGRHIGTECSGRAV
jgi:hypothetical protein